MSILCPLFTQYVQNYLISQLAHDEGSGNSIEEVVYSGQKEPNPSEPSSGRIVCEAKQFKKLETMCS